MFSGIAKLAREGRALEQKRRVEYRELPTRRLINRCESDRMPFRWTINPYRGCEFGCGYCYARYTHEFMEFHDPQSFETKIFAKNFNSDLLFQELKRLPREDPIALGTATDPYQPAERRFRLTRKILETFARCRGRRFGIVTKSDLVLRDIHVMHEVMRHNALTVSLTITTLDAGLARVLEPYAPRPDLRIHAVRSMARAGLDVGVITAPVLPGITDTRRSLESVARAAAAAGARRWGGGVLFLQPCAAKVFLPMLDEKFPHLAAAYRASYARGTFLKGEYADRMKQLVREIQLDFGLASSMPAAGAPAQGAFDFSAPV
jgi:DNA repair photolyase